MTIQTLSVQREFTAATPSAPRKQFFQAQLLTLQPLCLCGESFLCSFGCGSAPLGLRGGLSQPPSTTFHEHANATVTSCHLSSAATACSAALMPKPSEASKPLPGR
jgi:hypothetical protein